MALIFDGMKLADWLSAPGLKRTQDDLARKVGLTQGRISQIAAEGTTDINTALAISEATGGEVTLDDLRKPRKGRSTVEAAA